MSEPFQIIPNPYIVGNPIKNANMFYGRQDEFEFAKNKIKKGDKSYVIVYCGERRSGKTSILFQILSGQLGDNFLPILIDMQTMAGLNNDRDFLAEMAQEICRTLGDSRLKFRDFDFTTVTESPYKSFKHLLDKILQFYPERHLVIMIDEYEMMEEKFQDGTLSKDVVSFLAGLLESERRISFIFTGSRHLEQRSNVEYWRGLFGKSLYRRISFLSESDTSRLITEPVKDWVEFQPQTLETISRLTAGQPFYTQVVCQNLIDHLNEQQKNKVDSGDIRSVTEEILQNPLPQMIYIWNSLDDYEKLAMAVLSELQVKDNNFVPVTKILKSVKRKDRAFPLTIAQLQTAFANLYERELVSKQDDAFRIRIELIGMWIQREFSVWKILHDIRPEGSLATSETGSFGKKRILRMATIAVPILVLVALVVVFTTKWPFESRVAEPITSGITVQNPNGPAVASEARQAAETARSKMRAIQNNLKTSTDAQQLSPAYQSALGKEKAADSALAAGQFEVAAALFDASSELFLLAATESKATDQPVREPEPPSVTVSPEAQRLAEQARDHLVNKKAAARVVGAENYAKSEFNKGLELERSGNRERDAQNYAKAKDYYEEASRHFEQAATTTTQIAQALSEAKSRMDQFEQTMLIPEAAQVRKLGQQAETAGNVSQARDYYETVEKLYRDRLEFIAQMNFIDVPGGTFVMGNKEGRPDEQPVHEVTLDGFQISRYEVTNAQYAAFLNSGAIAAEQLEAWIDLSQPDCHIEQIGHAFRVRDGFEDHPVVHVTWEGASAFCQWVGGRLPSEAEWEYACRAGETRSYYFGEDPSGLEQYAWTAASGKKQSQAVGQKTANRFGLHDMLGNVWEWCSDWYDPQYYATKQNDNPRGPLTGDRRVLRGGAFNSNHQQCRASTRSALLPFDRYNSVGFRVVQETK